MADDSKTSWLQRVGLARPEQRAWALYDWANSAMVTVIITAVYPIYFSSVVSSGVDASAATTRHATVTWTSMLVVALLAPILGTLADVRGARKRFLAVALAVGAAAVGGLYFVEAGDWVAAVVLFGLANAAAATSFVFYDALLPAVARPAELDRVSTAAYALGYLGGGLLLALDLVLILNPTRFGLPADSTLPVRLAFVSVAVWWVAFSIPLLRRVPEPGPDIAAHERGRGALRITFARLAHTGRDLLHFREALLMMVAFFLYNDAIGTIIRMASTFSVELGLESKHVILAILLVQFIGVPCAFLFGGVAARIGTKPALFIGIAIYIAICLLGFRLRTTAEFYLMAFLVGVVQGGTQALSRSLFASMIPEQRAGEFFGFFSVLEKFAGILGPLTFGLVVARTGSSRPAILVLIAFLVAGGALLAFVDVQRGRERARVAERAAARRRATTVPADAPG